MNTFDGADGAQVPTHEASTVSEYVTKVLAIVDGWASAWRAQHDDEGLEVWYRGHSKTSYRLLPSAFRGNIDHDSMFNRFTTMAPQYLQAKPASEWEWYFTAQHHGIPTRLLDWTEDPFIGLHFAMLDALDGNGNRDDPPVVWIIEAASLNAILQGEDKVFVPHGGGAGALRPWLPGKNSELVSQPSDEHTDGRTPVAILPAWTTPRIQAQRGRFTVHGTEQTPLDEYYLHAKDELRRTHIARIRLENAKGIARELRRLGFALHRLFPEPERLAEHLKSQGSG